MYECDKLYIHHCRLEFEENDDFWQRNGPNNSN